jgi:hypothetical protein
VYPLLVEVPAAGRVAPFASSQRVAFSWARQLAWFGRGSAQLLRISVVRPTIFDASPEPAPPAAAEAVVAPATEPAIIAAAPSAASPR